MVLSSLFRAVVNAFPLAFRSRRCGVGITGTRSQKKQAPQEGQAGSYYERALKWLDASATLARASFTIISARSASLYISLFVPRILLPSTSSVRVSEVAKLASYVPKASRISTKRIAARLFPVVGVSHGVTSRGSRRHVTGHWDPDFPAIVEVINRAWRSIY